jgi:hypothetical protein
VAFAVSLGELLRLLLAFFQVPGPDRPAPAAEPLHGPEEIFFRMVRFEEFDVAELSLSTYVLTAQRDAPFVAIPVFPSRAFRHSGIYIHSGAGIGSPQDLVGAAGRGRRRDPRRADDLR